MAMNSNARLQNFELDPARRMPELESIKILFGQKWTGMGIMLDLDA
ncbi:hypothetical protein ACFLQK_00935 [bacterium]